MPLFKEKNLAFHSKDINQKLFKLVKIHYLQSVEMNQHLLSRNIYIFAYTI